MTNEMQPDKAYVLTPHGPDLSNPLEISITAHVVLLNSRHEVLLTTRRGKLAKYRDVGITETYDPHKDRDYSDTARRGLEEELGIPQSEQGDLLGIHMPALYLFTGNFKMIFPFFAFYDGSLKPHEDEIGGIEWITVEELLNGDPKDLNLAPMTPYSLYLAILQSIPILGPESKRDAK